MAYLPKFESSRIKSLESADTIGSKVGISGIIEESPFIKLSLIEFVTDLLFSFKDNSNKNRFYPKQAVLPLPISDYLYIDSNR